MKPRFLFPQHPQGGILIAPHQLNTYESQGTWIAQLKFQGSNCVIWVYNNEIAIWNRQGKPFTNYTIQNGMRKCFQTLNLKPNVEYVFNGELLHTKAKSKITKQQAATNTIVLFDILYAGKHLTETLEQRLALLSEICNNPQKLDKDFQGLIVAQQEESQLWLAETFYDEFSYHFNRFTGKDTKGNDLFPLIEGLMLKQKGSTNVGFGNKPIDVQWMTRCRKLKPKTYTL
jgi:hypothetical protein